MDATAVAPTSVPEDRGYYLMNAGIGAHASCAPQLRR